MQVNILPEYSIGVYAAIAINRYIALTQKDFSIVLYKKRGGILMMSIHLFIH